MEKEFYKSLAGASVEYTDLQHEKALHRESVALEAEVERRKAFFASHGRTDNAGHQSSTVPPNLWKYQRHYRQILPVYAPSLFVRCARGDAKTFFDVGAAPGGMCAYLCNTLKWSGRAVSLHEDAGGFPFAFTNPHTQLQFNAFDVATPDAWTELLHQHTDGVDHGAYDFINLGVTLQWKPATLVDGHAEKVQSRALVMQEIIRNELLFALHALKEGGSLLVTLPNSDHPNSFFYLEELLRCTDEPVRIIPTSEPTRNPVYVLCTDVKIGSPEVDDLISRLRSTEVSSANYHNWKVGTWEEAAPTFAACKRDLERLWAETTQALRRKRAKAEAEMTTLE